MRRKTDGVDVADLLVLVPVHEHEGGDVAGDLRDPRDHRDLPDAGELVDARHPADEGETLDR